MKNYLKTILISLLFVLILPNCGGSKSKGINPLFFLFLLQSRPSSSPIVAANTGTIDKYVWTMGTTPYTEITEATIINTAFSYDKIKLPFVFSYGNNAFTQVNLINKGALKLTVGDEKIQDINSSNMYASEVNVLSPWLGNIIPESPPLIEYKTSGSIPNRVFTIQWKNNITSLKKISFNFQIKIYETSNKIEFLYGNKDTSEINKGYSPNSEGENTNGVIGITGNLGNIFIEGKTGLNKISNFREYNYGDFPTRNTVYTFSPQGSGIATSSFDPLFPYQWHLLNEGQLGGLAGADANVVPVWNSGNKGETVRVLVVDDGMDIGHEDLKDNVVLGASYNYSNLSNNPSGSNANHGTCVAGVIGARDLNGIGVRGAAPRSSIFGYNLLQNLTTVNSGDAMTRGNFDISNNSWGASDNTGKYDESQAHTTWKNGIVNGITNQRINKGAIYLWAAGNGGGSVDNSNYDGQANFYGVMAIAAIGDDGKKASYSENGANVWVTSPSQGNSKVAITTTDNSNLNGYNNNFVTSNLNFSNKNYTQTFNGTSSATPLVAGVVALMLKERPALTWRDVKLILAETAKKTDPSDSGWFTGANKVSGGTYNFNTKYGFGAIDANAAVNLSKTWTSVGGFASLLVSTETNESPGTAIPDNDTTGITRVLNVAAGAGIGMNTIEFVEIRVNSAHTYAGDLDIRLISPIGKISQLALNHVCLNPSTGSQVLCGTFPSNTWRFGSAVHLGESPTGNWTLVVKDLGTGDTGNLTSWGIKFYGR